MGVEQELIYGCVQGFPISRNAVHASDGNTGSGSLPTRTAAAGWNSPHRTDQRMLNQGQNNFLTGPAGDNEAEPDLEGNIHCSEMETF